MKKLLFIFCLALIGLQTSFAQQEPQEGFEELEKQIEQMQKQLLEQFGNFDMNNGSEFQFFMDTMFIDLGDMGMETNPFGMTDPGMFNELFDEMQKQLSEMSDEDWAELEKLFKGFGENGFVMPFPPSSTIPKTEEKTIVGKKKRKTYKL